MRAGTVLFQRLLANIYSSSFHEKSRHILKLELCISFIALRGTAELITHVASVFGRVRCYDAPCFPRAVTA